VVLLSLADCEIICPLGRRLTCLNGWILLLIYCYLNFCNAFSISPSILSVSIPIPEAVLVLASQLHRRSSCNVLKYYLVAVCLLICSVAPPSAFLSLVPRRLFPPFIVRACRPGFPGQHQISIKSTTRLGAYRRLVTRASRCQTPPTSSASFSTLEGSARAPAPAPALTPSTRRANTSLLLPEHPASRQTGFDPLSAVTPSARASSLPDAPARSRPPVPHRSAALGFFP
jgi:hypothetical protein